jgi:DNA-binding transcriptional regulator YiaG
MSLASVVMPASKAPPVISPAQIRAARGLLRIKADELAKAAGVNVSTVLRFEAELIQGSPLGQRAMKAALEGKGVEFVGLHGVTLKRE